MNIDSKFEGWMGLDSAAADGNMVWQEFEPKTWEETDVDIKITHCGICGTDMHTLRSGWVSLDVHKSISMLLTSSGTYYVPLLRWT
jgi:hypothetical protein